MTDINSRVANIEASDRGVVRQFEIIDTEFDELKHIAIPGCLSRLVKLEKAIWLLRTDFDEYVRKQKSNEYCNDV